MAADPPAPAPPAARTIPWDLVFQGLGVGAAVAGWVAVVGGARVWARLEAAHIPATQTLAGLPRELFIVEGLQMLLFPLLLGGVVAVFVFFLLRREEQMAEERSQFEEQDLQARLALAEAEVDQTASAKADARSALDRAQAGAGEARVHTDRPQPTADDQEAKRVSDAEAGVSRAVDAAEKAEERLTDARRKVYGARMDQHAATLRRASAGWMSAPTQVVDRYGAQRAGLIAAFVAGFLILTALSIADVRWRIFLVVSVAASVLLAAAVWWLSKEPAWAAVIGALAGMSVGVVVALLDAVTLPTVVAMLVITVAAIWLTLIALARRRAGGAALTLFAALALWSGVLAFAQERGDRRPDLELVRVEMKDQSAVSGYFLGRSADRVYVAQDSEGSTVGDPLRHVLILDDTDVETVVYGGAEVLPEVALKDEAEEAEESGDDDRADSILEEQLETPQSGPGPEEVEPPAEGTSGGNASPDPGSEPLPPREPKRRLDSRIDGVPAQFQIIELVRRGRVLELDARLVNLSDEEGPPRDLRVGNSFDDGNPRDARNDSVDGLWLLDFQNRRFYLVDFQDGECACERQLREAVVEPGEARHLSASFIAPPASVKELDLVVPGFGFIRRVRVE